MSSSTSESRQTRPESKHQTPELDPNDDISDREETPTPTNNNPLPTPRTDLQHREQNNTVIRNMDWPNVPVSRDNWPNGFDPTTSDDPERLAYLKHKIYTYNLGDFQDGNLWDLYRQDFSGWTVDLFNQINQAQRALLRITLRKYGVCVNKDHLLSRALFDTLQENEPTEWTLQDIDAEVKKNGDFFRSNLVERKLRLRNGGNPNSNLNIPNPPQPPTPPAGQYQPPALSADEKSARDTMSLSKMMNQDSKYGGIQDSFDSKLAIFNNYCDSLNITSDYSKIKAYYLMLKDSALDHYNSNRASFQPTVPVAGAPLNRTFADICTVTRSYFETDEYRRSQQQRFNDLTLRQVITDPKNAEKSVEECLMILVQDLRKIQGSLDPTWREDPILRDRLLNACRDYPACSFACFKPAATLPALINDLQSSITTYEKANGPANQPSAFIQSDDEDDDPRAHYTNRQYHRSGPRPSYRSGYRSGYQPRNRHPRFSPNNKPKTCFVCKKVGCWSTKHSEEEREKSKAQFRARFGKRFDDHASQYIVDIEGSENEANLDDFEAFLQEIGDEDAEGFMSTALTVLTNQSVSHQITGAIPRALPDPFAYAPTSETSRYNADRFYGILVDTGASRVSTGGFGQFLAYQKDVDPTATLDTSSQDPRKITFGIGKTQAVGTLTIDTPIGVVTFHIVEADVPFLLCLDDLDILNATYHNLRDVVVTPHSEAPLQRQFGHPFILWGKNLQQFISSSLTSDSCFLTATELSRLHRRFGHPSVDRFHRLLEKSGHEIEKYAIEKLTKFCRSCQMQGKSPGRFKFKLPEDLDFNHTIYVDIFHLNGKPVLHVIDEATAFSAARFIRDLSTKTVWEALRFCWIDTYLGPPDLIVHDAGTNFTSQEFRQSASSLGISTKCVPVEAHWSVGKVERAHAALRRAYAIITEECPGTPKESCLQMALKAVNDSTGPEGLVPTLLVFGAFPRMVQEDPPAPSIQKRAAAIKKVMDEITKVRAKEQVNNALNTRNGPNTESLHDLAPNSKVLVYRENKGWQGPFIFVGISGETCQVRLTSGITDFRSTHVKPFHEQPNDEIDEDIDEPESQEQHQDPQPERPQRTRRAPSRYRQDADVAIHITTPSFVDSRIKEINGLLEKGVFEVVDIASVPQGKRIFNSRFVDTIKNEGTDQAFEKSRLVVQAYNDQEKELVLTQSPTIQRSSQRLILALAPSFLKQKYNLFLRDISQAYVQSTTLLNRDFYVRAPKEVSDVLHLDESRILKVIKPLYGIPEAGNHWFSTYHLHHTEKLKMKESTYDPCLLYTHQEGYGVVGLQTDDTLFIGDEKFAQAEESNLKDAHFLSKDRQQLTTTSPIKFNGGEITLQPDGSILFNQVHQCEGIKIVNLKNADLVSSRGTIRKSVTPKDQYIAHRAKGAYISSVCQPEAAFDLSYAAQIINPKEIDAKRLNKRLQWQLDKKNRGLRFVPLDLETLKLVVFADASFANNPDGSSQIGFIIVLADGNNNANIVHFSSLKCKRVTRSILASELISLAHAFDHGAVIKATIEKILQIKIPLILATDSRSLYECLVKLGSTREKRLMVDLMCMRQSYERRMITEIKWIEGSANPADAMTKSKPCQALRNLIETNKIDLTTKEWVERADTTKVEEATSG